jgi:hypothetical protein
MYFFIFFTDPPRQLLSITMEYRNGQLIRLPTGEEPLPGNVRGRLHAGNLIGWFRRMFITRERVPVSVDQPLGIRPGWDIWTG